EATVRYLAAELGQQGVRAIHGVGMASQFYFRERVSELDIPRIALLVGMIRGPSHYDPRRHPERALERRNQILAMLRDQGQLAPEAARRAMEAPLGVSDRAPAGGTPFPAFLELVRAQLQRDYREADLREAGLILLTTLDPQVQLEAEAALTERLARLEAERDLPEGSLQGAVVVTGADSGEVLALVGGRNVRRSGFNRALHASRPVGSVIKPFVYLTALSRPERFSLATLLEDAPLNLQEMNGQVWSPENSDRSYHGTVTLQEALVHSYNLATVRLGLEVGVERVADRIEDFGLGRALAPYPSLLLGAVEMTPLEVAGLYQGLASGGYRVPPRAIRAVMDREGERLSRYGLSLSQVAGEGPVYLVTAALHQVTRSGTASSLRWRLPDSLPVAGKTGTTGDLRDAWFAGYTGDMVSVVWVGRDDNGPTGLSGSTGALPIWADVVGRVSRQGLSPTQPEGVEWVAVDPATGLRAGEGCDGARWMPFLEGSAPEERAPCAAPAPHRPAGDAPSWWPG
ncbi:MAG: penicillin-binding transpeptidase domain-containing protein, partial [Ectothiorhodospira sp.]